MPAVGCHETWSSVARPHVTGGGCPIVRAAELSHTGLPLTKGAACRRDGQHGHARPGVAVAEARRPDRYRGKVTFVGIDIDDQAGLARGAARQAGLTYTLLEDAGGKAAAAYRVVNLPTTVLIAPDGTLALRHTGAISRADLSDAIDQLLPASH